MTTKVTPLGLRLFLEGVEVPVISSQVNLLPDQPASASIQIIPTDMGLHLLPRTLVHLFYLDDEILPNPPPAPRVSEDGNTENNLNRFDALDEQYKTLFTGEVVGFNYGKNPSSRQLVLQCMDLSTYWDTCYQWFADYSVGGSGLTDKSHNFVGAGKSMFNNVAGGHQWVIGRLLNTKPASAEYQKAKGLLAGILHLFEAIGGIKYRSNGEPGFNGVNDFFTIAELRYNLLGMIGAIEEDETSSKMYANKAFRSWLRNGMTSLGTLLSFRDIINHVNKHIFHHIYPNPCAKYTPPASITKRVSTLTTLWTDFPTGLVAKDLVQKAQISAGAAQNFFARASIAAATDFVGATKEFESARTTTDSALTSLKGAVSLIEDLKSDDRAGIYSKVSEAQFKTEGIQSKTGRPGERPLPSNFSEVVRVANESAKEVADTLLDVLGMKERSKSNRKKDISTTEGARFPTQLFLPETFFVAPPRCNVIFPDQYFQFSFSRNFMREVSRLCMQAGVGMLAGGRRGASLFSRFYFAPNIKDVRGRNLFATTDQGARVLLPHEIHSGIIPKSEWVPDGHRWGLKAAKETGKKDEFVQSGKVGYLQRLANYQFYLHRWSARTMAIGGVFNSRLALGLPALVMDRSMPAPQVVKMYEERLGRRWMPVQYLGKTASISHSINQAGGQTQAQFTHCRTHRGIDDEFLGVLTREVEQTTGQQFTVKFRPEDLVNSIDLSELPKSADAERAAKTGVILLGTGFRRVIKDREDFIALLRLYAKAQLNPGTFVKGSEKWRGSKIVKVEEEGAAFLSESQAAQLGIDTNENITVTKQRVKSFTTESVSYLYGIIPGEEEVVEGSEIYERFQAPTGVLAVPAKLTITLERRIGTGKFKRVNRTVEQALTPGWYSSIWSNDEIGEKVYRPLLGCEAIVDNISLEKAEQDAFLDHTIAEEAKVQLTKLNPDADAGASSVFSYQEESQVPGSQAQLQIVPGSIEEAVDALTIIYGIIRLRGGDIHEFIREYTRRPVANMKEILGSQELEFDEKGNIDPSLSADVVEGFHSRAFGDYNTNVRLPDREGTAPVAGDNALAVFFPGEPAGKNVKRRSIIDRGEPKSAIKPELDPRGRAQARVRAYVEELSVSRGLMG